MCHKYGTLACFDYAAVGPYIDINMKGPSKTLHKESHMSEEEKSLSYKDAIFLSPHKFIGGPGSSGVLLAKKKILYSRKPHR